MRKLGKNKAILVAILVLTTPFLLTACFKSNKKPIASFTVSSNSGYVPLEVSFNATDSYDPDGSILSYQWDFKDGNSGSGEITSHTFDTQGNYNVKLTVTDNEGVTNSTTRLIEILQAPLEILNWSLEKDNWSVWIEGTAQNTSGSELSYCEIWGYFYDENNARIGEWLDNILNLGANETWAFEITCLDCWGGNQKW